MKFKNMKIAITDEAHLKAVCDVLGSMGLHQEEDFKAGFHRFIHVGSGGFDFWNTDMPFGDEVTLTDLLAMRDQIFMESIR